MIRTHSLRMVTICFIACLLLFLSCTEKKSEKQTKTPDDKITLKIGLIPEQNIFEQIRRYKIIGEYLENKINIGLDFKVLTRYGNIVTNFEELELDGAFFGSFVYTMAHAKLEVNPIVRPENPDGSTTYHGLIFIRNDSGINSFENMRGKTFAFVDKATTAGYLLPLAYFKINGITDYNKYFKKTYFTGTHEDSINDVLNKKADIGAAKNTVFYRLMQADPRIADELRIISRSPDVPENSLALKKNIGEKIKNKIKDTLINMHNDPEGKKALVAFGATRFLETRNSDYQSVYNYADEIGLDLKSYDYIND